MAALYGRGTLRKLLCAGPYSGQPSCDSFRSSDMNYEKICFIVMPFGVKDVGDEKVNFDALYEDIFVPAISAVPLPEGGTLEPRRTDKDFFSGDIKLEMFQYLEYSRFVL